MRDHFLMFLFPFFNKGIEFNGKVVHKITNHEIWGDKPTMEAHFFLFNQWTPCRVPQKWMFEFVFVGIKFWQGLWDTPFEEIGVIVISKTLNNNSRFISPTPKLMRGHE